VFLISLSRQLRRSQVSVGICCIVLQPSFVSSVFFFVMVHQCEERKMAVSAQKAFNNITKFIDENGGNYQRWYAGVTSDPETSLFKVHHVAESEKWVYSPCANGTDSRNVKMALLDLGCDGDPGDGDNTASRVYVFLKSSRTNPKL
jgi:hypothetical protein